MSFFSLYYHFVWHTKISEACLTGEKERRVHEIIKTVVFRSPNLFFVSIGGTATHVHVIIYTKSTLTVAQMAQRMKGSSSEMINEQRIFPFRFGWQREYGCVTFSHRDLAILKLYLRDQKNHHENDTFQKHLECTDFRDLGLSNAWGEFPENE